MGTNRLFATVLLLAAQLLFPPKMAGQCDNQVSVPVGGGWQQFDCTSVSVTESGSVYYPYNGCGYGPYWIGHSATGSYTFTFVPPVSGVSVSLSALHNRLVTHGREELRFDVNGVFYPLTAANAGTADGCSAECYIAPGGTILSPADTSCSWANVTITETISTLKVSDVWLIGSPVGSYVSVLFCCGPDPCPTDAGEIFSDAIHVCGNGTATVPPAEQPFLDLNDILRYVLFSNPGDTVGSIVATSAVPSFTFNPATMQKGTTYYIAAVAANHLPGNTIDYADPCLDFSNAIPVTWHDRPAATFTVADPDLCPGDCKTINVAFTGTPPFTLTYESLANGTVTEVFPTASGSIVFCPPDGFPLGSLLVEATSVEDAWCACP